MPQIPGVDPATPTHEVPFDPTGASSNCDPGWQPAWNCSFYVCQGEKLVGTEPTRWVGYIQAPPAGGTIHDSMINICWVQTAGWGRDFGWWGHHRVSFNYSGSQVHARWAAEVAIIKATVLANEAKWNEFFPKLYNPEIPAQDVHPVWINKKISGVFSDYINEASSLDDVEYLGCTLKDRMVWDFFTSEVVREHNAFAYMNRVTHEVFFLYLEPLSNQWTHAFARSVLNKMKEEQKEKLLAYFRSKERKAMPNIENVVLSTPITKPEKKTLKLFSTFRVWQDQGLHINAKSEVMEKFFKDHFGMGTKKAPNPNWLWVSPTTTPKLYNVGNKLNKPGSYIFDVNTPDIISNNDGTSINLTWMLAEGLSEGIEVVIPGLIEYETYKKYHESAVAAAKDLYLRYMKRYDCMVEIVVNELSF